jgi:hypothetical protein
LYWFTFDTNETDTTIEDYDKDYVEVGWKPPVNDGGAPIEKYIIEKAEKGRPEWQHVSTKNFFLSKKQN